MIFLNGCWILELTGVSAFAFPLFFCVFVGGRKCKVHRFFSVTWLGQNKQKMLNVEEIRYWRYLEINWKQPIPQDEAAVNNKTLWKKKSQDESAQCISNRKKLPICWVSLSIFWQSTDKASIKYLLGKFLLHIML